MAAAARQSGGNSAGSGGNSAGSGGTGAPMITGNFSFFVTSLVAMRRAGGRAQDGFGGDLGGLAGRRRDLPAHRGVRRASGHKTWRAFLSATTGGPNGGAVHAIDRIGEGPWYDRKGRLVAMNKAGLMMAAAGGDAAIVGEPARRKGRAAESERHGRSRRADRQQHAGPPDGHRSRLDVQRLDEQRGIDRADRCAATTGRRRSGTHWIAIASSGRLREGHLDSCRWAARWA